MISQSKMAAVYLGDTRKICMNDYGKKFFKGVCLSQERRYRALTYRCSFNISERALI